MAETISFSEADATLAHFGNIFRAAERIREALAVAREVEGNRAALETENARLVEARAQVEAAFQDVELTRIQTAQVLDTVRAEYQQESAAILNAEVQKRKDYEVQSQNVLAQCAAKQLELSGDIASLTQARDALLVEIRRLEDRRDEMKGIAVTAPSAQVRLANE